MNHTPGKTPPVITKLIIWTCSIWIVIALINPITLWMHLTPLQSILSLSYWGLSHYLIWQPVTYLFTIEFTSSGLSMFSLLGLFLQIYLLWFTGSMIVDDVGSKSFLRLYFFTGIASGLATILLSALFGSYPILSGAMAAVLGIFTVWIMLYPNLELFLFFLIPIKAKWLFMSLVGAILLISLTQFNFPAAILNLSAVFFSYLYAAMFWNLRSPWKETRPMEAALASFGVKVMEILSKLKEASDFTDEQGKFFDIRTGKALFDDDAFVDAMLAKISRYGEKSLTWRERRRLKKISDKKNRK